MSRTKLGLILVGCLAGAWLGWRLLMPPPPAKTDPARSEAPSSRPAAVETTVPDSATREVSPPIAASRYSESDSKPAAAAPPDSGPLLLAVVLAPDDRPAGGATVQLFRPDASDEFYRSSWSELFARTTPTQLVADGAGIVTLPVFKGCVLVDGRRESFRGRTVVWSGITERQVLRLGAQVTALVVDAAGAPKEGVPVAAYDEEWFLMTPFERGITGKDGLVHLLPPLRPRKAGAKEGSSERCLVALAIPVAEPVVKRFDAEGPPATPLTLVLPPIGRLVVKLVRADGSPFADAAAVRLRSNEERQITEIGGDNPADTISIAATGGTASFPIVGLDGGLVVRVNPADPALTAVETVVPGPRTGAETAVTVTVGANATIVTGRLVTSAGAPVGNVSIDGWIQEAEDGNGMRDKSRVMFQTVQPDGRFTLRFETDAASLKATEIQLGVADPGKSGVREPQTIKFPLPASVRSGRADLGDVVVPEVLVLAAGVVVGSDGSPVAQAEVELMRKEASSWSRTFEKVRAGPDGRFEVRGEAGAKGLGLVARSDGWICVDPEPFAAGDRDVRIVLTKAGGISGSLKGISKGWSTLSRSPFEIEVKGANVAPTARDSGWRGTLPLPVSDQGVFETSRLLPGSYSVRIKAPEATEPILVVDDVIVRAGEITRDPRLQDIDVSKLGKSRVVTVVDEQGEPLRAASVAAVVAQGGGRTFTTVETGANGRATVVTLTPSAEIVIAMKGRRSEVRKNVTGDMTVTLTKTAPRAITVRLADSVRLPEPPLFLSATVNWLCGLSEPRPEEGQLSDPRSGSLGSLAFGEERSLTITVDDPGVYEVLLWLVEKEADGHSAGTLEQPGGKNATVAVPEDAPASVTVTVDAETLRKAVERTKK